MHALLVLRTVEDFLTSMDAFLCIKIWDKISCPCRQPAALGFQHFCADPVSSTTLPREGIKRNSPPVICSVGSKAKARPPNNQLKALRIPISNSRRQKRVINLYRWGDVAIMHYCGSSSQKSCPDAALHSDHLRWCRSGCGWQATEDRLLAGGPGVSHQKTA